MSEVNPEVLRAITAASERYIGVVEASMLAPSSKKETRVSVDQFIRWLSGDFIPGRNRAN